MKKSQTTTKNTVLLLLFYIEKIMLLENICKFLAYIVAFVSHFFRVAGY